MSDLFSKNSERGNTPHSLHAVVSLQDAGAKKLTENDVPVYHTHGLCVSAEKRALKKQDEEITQLKTELQYLIEVCETNLETKDWPRFKYAKRIAARSNVEFRNAASVKGGRHGETKSTPN